MTPPPQRFTPLLFLKNRFLIQSTSLWRLMKLLRPYRRQIILANLMASLATAMAGFCLLSLHPLFQVALARNHHGGSATAAEHPAPSIDQTLNTIVLDPGSAAAPPLASVAPPDAADSAPDSVSAGEPAPEEPAGLTGGKIDRIRQYAERYGAAWAPLGRLVKRAEASWDRFFDWAGQSPSRLMIVYTAFIVLLYFLSQLFSFLGDYLMGQMTLHVTMGLMREVYASVLRQEFNFFSTNTTGALLNLCYRQVMQLRSIINFLVSTRIMIPVDLMIMFGVLLGISVKLSMLLLLFLPLVILPALWLVRRLRKSLAEEVGEESGSMEVMAEGFHGILAVKAFGAEEIERESLEPSIDKYVRSSRKRQAAASMMGPFVDFMNMMVILIVFILTMFVLRRSMDLDQGKIVLFLFAVTRFHKPLRSLLTMNIQMQRSAQVAQRIFEIVDRQPHIQDAPDAVEFPPHWRTIELDDVSLVYFAKPKSKSKADTPSQDAADVQKQLQQAEARLKAAAEKERGARASEREKKRLVKLAKRIERQKRQERPALLHVNLLIRRGEKIALIGPNGAGKSSMVNLLCRLYDPTEGEVRVEGVPFPAIKLASLHEHVCLVTQHPVLFNRSVRENIAFGLEGVTDEQIVAAATATGAHDFISRLPQKYDTKIGEGGRHLSGGERQKIALARAFVRNPDILILDEPTTGLDYRTTQEFMERVFHPRNEHLTIVFITHEPSQLSRFDRVLRVTPEKTIVDEPPARVPAIEQEHEPLAGQQYPA